MEGLGRSFPDIRLTFQVRKVIGSGGVGWGARMPEFGILSRLDSTMTSVRVESEDPNRKRPKIL